MILVVSCGFCPSHVVPLKMCGMEGRSRAANGRDCNKQFDVRRCRGNLAMKHAQT